MDLSHYTAERDGGFSVSREQASRFAKSVAGDFNPIHDTDARRFCVPGDLLFSVLLHRIGLHRRIAVDFTGMVDEHDTLRVDHSAERTALVDGDKTFLVANHAGALPAESAAIAALTAAYVSYSGQTFPHILVPLWRAHGVMVNPARPMVMYRSMQLQLERSDLASVTLLPRDASMNVDGKKGAVTLPFDVADADGTVVGHGEKHMLLSGLRAWEDDAVDGIVEAYDAAKRAWPEPA
ncbi:MAG: DUF3581 family protein [Pseudomonadota bacterium]